MIKFQETFTSDFKKIQPILRKWSLKSPERRFITHSTVDAEIHSVAKFSTSAVNLLRLELERKDHNNMSEIMEDENSFLYSFFLLLVAQYSAFTH